MRPTTSLVLLSNFCSPLQQVTEINIFTNNNHFIRHFPLGIFRLKFRNFPKELDKLCNRRSLSNDSDTNIKILHNPYTTPDCYEDNVEIVDLFLLCQKLLSLQIFTDIYIEIEMIFSKYFSYP